MKCDHIRPERIFDLTKADNPNSVRVATLRYICIRARRNVPVSRQQIGKWLARTPADAIDAALESLVADGKVQLTNRRYAATEAGLPPGYR